METFTVIAGIGQGGSTLNNSPVRRERTMASLKPGRRVAAMPTDDRQYPLTLKLRYRVYRGLKPVGSGEGRTQFVSSGSALFTSRQELERGLRIELLMDWPALRDDQAPLQLFMTGTIVLNMGERVLVRASHCDLRLKPHLVKASPATAWACASSG